MSISQSHEALSSISLREIAIKNPNQISLACEDEEITALELNQMINSFAQTLSQIPQVPKFLPILLGPNVNSVIAYHAAIRSRTKFALIDSNVNTNYLNSILSRLGKPKFLINTNSEKKELTGCDQISIGRNKLQDFAIPQVELDELASVLFTSGSTGQPKGVLWDWNTFDTLYEVNRNYLSSRGESNKIGRFSSLAFTAGARQAMSVTLGHQLFMINSTHSPDEIIKFVNNKEITDLAFSTSFGERLFETKSPSLNFNSVREITIYGESVNWVQISKFRELTSNKAAITNIYGATEAPGTSIQYRIEPTDSTGEGRIPLAYASKNPSIGLIPLGEVENLHELTLQYGVARGYFENGELTNQKFITNSSGIRVYASGDLVRIGTDGLVTYVGRRDDLVKINGRLVDPSESEAVLRTIPGIKLLVVIPEIDSRGKTLLVAHIVLDSDSDLKPSEIYSKLLEKLSSHLVPSKLVKHSDLPLNSNGKIDRQYLLNKEWSRWIDEVPPGELNMHERFALNQLQQVLNAPYLTATEDIFGAGMDSLAAIEFEVAASVYGYTKINPSIFLKYRTAKAIGKFLADEGAELESNIVEINKSGQLSPIFIFPGAGVTAIFFKELADAFGQNQPLFVIEPRGLHTMQNVEESIHAMAASAAADIDEIFPQGEIHLIGHSAGSMIACVAGMNLSAAGRNIKMVNLDAIALANQLAMSGRKYEVVARLGRSRDLLTRSPSSIRDSILRRLRAQKGDSYEFFLLHIGKLALKHKLKSKPDFKIHVLYCESKQRFKDWETNSLLSYEKIEGTHKTILNREYLPNVVPKIVSFFQNFH